MVQCTVDGAGTGGLDQRTHRADRDGAAGGGAVPRDSGADRDDPPGDHRHLSQREVHAASLPLRELKQPPLEAILRLRTYHPPLRNVLAVDLDGAEGDAETDGDLAGVAVQAEECVLAAVPEVFGDEGV